MSRLELLQNQVAEKVKINENELLLEKILFLLAPDQKAFEVLPHYVKSALEQS